MGYGLWVMGYGLWVMGYGYAIRFIHNLLFIPHVWERLTDNR
jgi:hypothetical protein